MPDAATKQSPLKEVVHAQSDALLDVCALIRSAQAMLNVDDGNELDPDAVDRVLSQARRCAMDIVHEFDLYI